MKVRNKISLHGIINVLRCRLYRLFYMGCILSLAACLETPVQALEEVAITNVFIELIEPSFASSIQLGEPITLTGSYTYVGDDHRCKSLWLVKFPDGTRDSITAESSGRSRREGGINTSGCTNELYFTPAMEGAYEIEYEVTAYGFGLDDNDETEVQSNTYSFTVTDTSPDSSCLFFDLVVSPEEVTVAPGMLAAFSVSLENVSDDWVPHSIIGGERAINFSLRQINDAGEPVFPTGLGVVNGVGSTGGLNRENTEGSFRPRIEDNAPAGRYRFVVTPDGGPEEDICFSNEFVIVVED